MTVLEQALEGTKSVAILGHVRPDGDCLGSTLGLYNYLLASLSGYTGLYIWRKLPQICLFKGL